MLLVGEEVALDFLVVAVRVGTEPHQDFQLPQEPHIPLRWVLVALVAHLLVAQEQMVQITGQLVLILCLALLLQMVEAAAGMVTRAMV